MDRSIAPLHFDQRSWNDELLLICGQRFASGIGEHHFAGLYTSLNRTYGRERAITPHSLYLLIRKGVTLVLSDVRAGRKHEWNVPTTAKLDLFVTL